MKKYIALGLIIMHSHIQPITIHCPSLCDEQNMFEAIYSFPDQMEASMKIGAKIKLNHTYTDINHILFTGMGGSGMAGNMVKTLIQQESAIPISIHKNYDLPNWVNEQTLVICLSYSGSTEETLSCFEAARKKNAPIIGITSGGILCDVLLRNNYDVIHIPDGLAPRAALGYLSIPLLYLMKKLGITNIDADLELGKAITLLKKYRTQFSNPCTENPAYAFAKHYSNLLPVIYGEHETTAIIAQRWQAQFAENSKMIARVHVLPEMDHNEIVGWQENPTLLKQSIVIWLIDLTMHPRNRARQRITREVIGNTAAAHLDIEGIGESWCQRMFYLVHLGDWISYWCALAHNVDPTVIRNIDMLKEKMRNA